MLEELYENDQEMSHELLLRKLNSWGKQTLFAVADTAKQMDFMEQDCCQTKLNKIWFGRITAYTKMWQVREINAFFNIIRKDDKVLFVYVSDKTIFCLTVNNRRASIFSILLSNKKATLSLLLFI